MMSKKYWFAAKRYGYGWGLPSSWQGWVIFIAYLLTIFINIIYFNSHATRNRLASFLFILFLATGIFIFTCYKKGEKPQWRWGKKK